MLKKSLLSEKGISLLTALIFNLVTLLVGVAWLKFSVDSALSTTKIRIEKTRNDYLLKGFNSLIKVQETSMDFFKTKYLADFEVRYKPSYFFPKFESLRSIDRAVLEVKKDGVFKSYLIRTKISDGKNKVTSLKADSFVQCENIASFAYLTDCERQRQEFVPPDSTNQILEDCSASDKFLLLNGPDRISGNFHTNDFIFFGPPISPVQMLGCVTASGSFEIPPPINIGSLMFPPPPLAGVQFFSSCNSAGVVVHRKKINFGEFPEKLIKDALKGGFYYNKENEVDAYRIVFDSKGFSFYSTPKLLLETFGPSTWSFEKHLGYPENGAIFFETDVYVSGLVNSDLTVGSCGNIFIDNDLKYSGMDSTGLNLKGNNYQSFSKLGLISAKNIYLETRHIATNKGFSWSNFDSTYAHNNHQEGVIINAGILALGESFSTLSSEFPNFKRFPSDEFGGLQNPKFPVLGNHGTITFFGSIAQRRKGITNNAIRGGFGGSLTGTGSRGPSIIRVYDERFNCNPPKYFPKIEQNLSLVVR